MNHLHINNRYGITFPDMTPAYGSFSSRTTQDITQNVALAITHDTIDITPRNIYTTTLPSPNIYVRSGGVYKVLASIQCNKTTGGSGEIDTYIAVNGTADPNSATKLNINQTEESVVTVEWFLELNKDDAIAIYAFSPDIGCQVLAVPPSSPVPAIPSIITTIMRIG
jgi:hypothetical protein